MGIVERMGRIEDNFTMIPNALARSSEISPRAKAVYLFVSSHETGWRLNSRGIASQLGISQDTVNKGLRELETLGWVKRTQTMTEDSKFSTVVYQVFTVTENLGHVTQNVGHGNVGTEDLGHIKKTNSFKKTNESKNTKSARERATACEIDKDWKPDDLQAKRLKDKHPDKSIDEELSKFIVWHQAKGVKRKDWYRAFDNWLKKARSSRQQFFEVDDPDPYGLRDAPF